ncbi:TIR domain-containing protein [Vreelandella sp. H-I2]
MARKVFYSFHFQNDYWRTSQVRQIGALEGNQVLSSNSWEEVKQKGDSAIKKWIDDNLKGKSCLIVLVGEDTADRKYVKYEIQKAWEMNKGIVGIRIDKLLDNSSLQGIPGPNPFNSFNLDGTLLSQIVRLYDPNGADSKAAYNSISSNIEGWVEEAIKIRNKY